MIMLPDFTHEIILDSKNNKIYRALRFLLYAISFFGAIYLAFLILFPEQNFVFSFLTPDASSNTATYPKDASGNAAEHGQAKNGNDLYFYVSPNGNFSDAEIDFTLNSKSPGLNSGTVQARKSYQAFLYPDGDPIGFKDGSLLKNKNDYYIVSNGNLRKFENSALLDSLGYSRDAFNGVSDDELKYDPPGQIISDPNYYPDDSIFKITGDYYILKEGKLKKFSSENAYLSQYDILQAIEKNDDFLRSYPLSEELEGFGDSSLVSYGGSIYIISEGKILPINNPVTFVASGFDWNDVIPASADEISLYAKTRLFSIQSPHPNGTVFFASNGKTWYIIKDAKKHLLPSENIARSWIKHNPVSVSLEGLDIINDCKLTKKVLSFRTYACIMPIENFNNLIGKDYEFKANFGNDVKIDSLNVIFRTKLNFSNLRTTLGVIFNRIKNNYVSPPATP